MPLTFNYKCQGCGVVKSNQELDSFACRCGGNYRMVDDHMLQTIAFDAHFNDTIGDTVTSWHDMEQKAKRAKTDKHPQGYMITDPKGKFAREMRGIRKHKEDYVQEQYAKKGIKYPVGKNQTWSDSKGCFIPRGSDPYSRSGTGKVFSFRRG